jgi:hypothetical protein
MRHQWIVQRNVQVETKGHRRWDRAYQRLLAWTKPEPWNENNSTPRLPPKQEKNRENSDLHQSVHPAPGADTDQ